MATGGEARSGPTQAATSEKVQPRGITFEVNIDKAPGASLGIDITYSSGGVWSRQGIAIARIFDDGSVAPWNASSKTHKVQPGDFIVQVNDVKGDTTAMIAEMKTQQHLVLHIWRQDTTAPPPSASGNGADNARSPPVQQKPSAAPSTTELLSQIKELGDVPAISLVCAVLHTRPSLAKTLLEEEVPEERGQGQPAKEETTKEVKPECAKEVEEEKEVKNGDDPGQEPHAKEEIAQEVKAEVEPETEAKNGDELQQDHQVEENKAEEEKVEPAVTNEAAPDNAADGTAEAGEAADTDTQAEAEVDVPADAETKTPASPDADADVGTGPVGAEATTADPVETEASAETTVPVDSEAAEGAAPEDKPEAEEAEGGDAPSGTAEEAAAVAIPTEAETEPEAIKEPEDPAPDPIEGTEESTKEAVVQDSEKRGEQPKDAEAS